MAQQNTIGMSRAHRPSIDRRFQAPSWPTPRCARLRSIGAIALIGGSLSPAIVISPLAQADHADEHSHPGAHAASAVILETDSRTHRFFELQRSMKSALTIDDPLPVYKMPQWKSIAIEENYSVIQINPTRPVDV